MLTKIDNFRLGRGSSSVIGIKPTSESRGRRYVTPCCLACGIHNEGIVTRGGGVFNDSGSHIGQGEDLANG